MSDIVYYRVYTFLMNLTPYFFFFFNDTATTEIYTLSLHDALPIWMLRPQDLKSMIDRLEQLSRSGAKDARSEEHTSELQSQSNLVCRLLLEKKKTHSSKPCSSWIPVA